MKRGEEQEVAPSLSGFINSQRVAAVAVVVWCGGGVEGGEEAAAPHHTIPCQSTYIHSPQSKAIPISCILPRSALLTHKLPFHPTT